MDNVETVARVMAQVDGIDPNDLHAAYTGCLRLLSPRWRLDCLAAY